MKSKLIKFAQVAGISLALVFTFSCSGGDNDGGGDPNNGGTSSPSGGGNSGGGSSPSGGGIKYGEMKDKGGKTYKTVKIGNQTWMAENLNYETAGSVCYDKKEANCVTYGRLYDWETAMSACPNGWHLPDTTEWKILWVAVGGYRTAGGYLKSKSGWEKGGNGEDKYGFSALPGGLSDSGVYYEAGGESGYWWSASEHNSGSAYNMYMLSSYSGVGGVGGSDDSHLDKDIFLISVRCLKDD